MNFHFSFGSGIFLGTGLYLLFYTLVSLIKAPVKSISASLRQTIIIPLFLAGFLLAFLPSIVFESRHGYHQIRAGIQAATNSFLYNSAVVGQTGLSQPEIIQRFLKMGENILHLPNRVIAPTLALVIILALTASFRPREKKLLTYLFLSLAGVAVFYLSSKNPVWEYHFIGVEMIVIVILVILVGKNRLAKFGLFAWALFIFTSTQIIPLAKPLNPENILTFPSLKNKEYVVKLIYQDADGKPFTAFAYSPAIYTYDYDYLFKWLGEKENQPLPPDQQSETETTYLIIPPGPPAVKQDFINYKTPTAEYHTTAEWNIPDGTTITKRGRKP